jgi:hypothetical protein
MNQFSIRRFRMRRHNPRLAVLAVVLVVTLVGCSKSGTKSADVSGRIRKSLDQAGFINVSAAQDRDKGVITLSGSVGSEAAKLQAESIAKSIATGETVSNQIVVIAGNTTTQLANNNSVKPFNPDLDKGIYAALAITSQSDPRSDCQQHTDVYLLNSSLRTISVNIKRSNNVDKQTSLLTYTLNPSTPLGDGSGSTQNSTLKIGCQFDGAKTYTYTITRADYR